MIKVCIGNNSFEPVEDVLKANLQKQIANANPTPCVRVQFKCPNIDLTLGTGACQGMPLDRELTRAEEALLEKWKDRDLNADDLSPGRLVAFLRKAQKHYC